ncbi:hypothetical protein CR513_15433, partial [Mucuna pruriens]
MTAYIYDDKVLIHYFQDSMIRMTLSWYVSLERGRIKTWRDLVEAFLKQYKYNEDMAPDGSQLQNMVKKEQEGFKEYAWQWHELVAQVQPPIIEREMITMFIGSLPSPYYDRVVGNVASNFADLVVVGERIEFAQTNKVTSFAKKTTSEKKKGETNTVLIEPIFPRSRSDKVLTPIPMTYTKLFPLLLEQKLIEVVPLKPLEPPYPRSYDPNARCDYHGGAIEHATKRCKRSKHKVQYLLNNGLLGFEDKGPNMHKLGQAVDLANRVEEESYPYPSDNITIVAYIEGNDNPRLKPLIIQYNSAPRPAIQVLAKPVYNNNAVPWRYPTEEPQAPQIKEETTSPKITNIAGVGGMTRNERIFVPKALRNKELALVKKEKTVESPKRMVTKEEAREFLKSHCELLLKILNEAHVLQDIKPAKFGGIINNITASHHISFSKEEVPNEGKNHNQPLHIIIKYGNYMIVMVLIDNGSSLNVMPKTTLDKLYAPGAILRNSSVVVRAFDGSKQKVMGEITLPILIGPTTFDITFQVMDIQPTYSCLLGQPWIHAVGAVPSSLHQKVKFITDGQQVKFITDGQLISVMGEKEMMVSTPFPMEYIEEDEEALETSFKHSK